MAREFVSTVLLEYRGLGRESGEFTDQESGQVIPFTATARFEYDEDGIVRNRDFRTTEFDDVANFDVLKLNRGDMVEAKITLVAFEKKNGIRSWFETISSAKLVKAPATAAAAA